MSKQILDLIQHRREARKQIKKAKSKQKGEPTQQVKRHIEEVSKLKQEYNSLTSRIRQGLKMENEKKWYRLAKEERRNPTSSISFWKKINEMRNGCSVKSIPALKQAGHLLESDQAYQVEKSPSHHASQEIDQSSGRQ